ncbi:MULTISPECIES: hypothetical protein [Salegentibacter]|mgnify:CR=1 FL=1|jgi:hypothetical protein|uniref:Uncharacterized protein n=1 Tax=Salegentibacter agarivorans TaxID=345907 RepID=A0A1I2K4H8_9FLAO|nr:MULTISPECIES: hypothetical protein [Salegentibacter]APS39263.1 hypothetical protein AO058_10445 [Salegentibacter sp. T436]SFF59826.1 hypothetical protein SAMN04488033_101273 [Salegentibacter agarivorans]
MKISNFFLFFLVLFSCSENENNNSAITGESGVSYNESKKVWSELKNINGNSYSYTISFISWSGFGNRTIISVKDGIISKREYLYYEQTYSDEGEMVEVEIKSYTETGEEIGSNSEGFDPLLIDELYQTCLSDYLNINKADNEIYFNTDEAGIISNCGFVETGCVDDCFRGFRISEFNWL